MEGESTLIVGRGRAGKTGFALDLLDDQKTDKKIIIVPQITNNELLQYDSIDWPVMSAQELADAFNKRETDAFVVIVSPLVKDQPSIFVILLDPMFRDFVIFADELAVLTSDNDDKIAFKNYIRHVGQNNQKFFGTSHRIIDDMPPVTALNVQKIYFVGQLSNSKEIQNLYDVSNIDSEMTLDEFTEKLKSQPKKYNWWDKKPDKNAVFLIFY